MMVSVLVLLVCVVVGTLVDSGPRRERPFLDPNTLTEWNPFHRPTAFSSPNSLGGGGRRSERGVFTELGAGWGGSLEIGDFNVYSIGL